MWNYTEKVMDHFRNPRNVGTIENPDGTATVGDPDPVSVGSGLPEVTWKR